jgi:acetyl-CoA acyltransferase
VRFRVDGGEHGGASSIRSGEGDLFIAGGVESMSRAPYSLPKAESGFPFGNLTAWDTALGWRYPNPKLEGMGHTDSLGETAEKIADAYGITRQEQDAYACESHRRAIAAMDTGRV